jgi:hypothetical protein
MDKYQYEEIVRVGDKVYLYYHMTNDCILWNNPVCIHQPTSKHYQIHCKVLAYLQKVGNITDYLTLKHAMNSSFPGETFSKFQ